MNIYLEELGMAREYARGHAFEDLSSEHRGYTMLGKSRDEWIRQYSTSHQNPVNRACHTVGIPMIAISILMIPVAIWQPQCWWWAIGLFVLGWIFQFIGHAFEGKPPEFFKDWRFLFVGLSWWFAKLAGRA